MIGAAALLLLAQFGPPAPAAAATVPDHLPEIGVMGPEFDACGGVGRVSGADEVQIVRGAPSEQGSEVDRLDRRTLVWLCEADGEWQGIVYPSGQFQDIADCRVGSPVAEPREYDGPCKAGWLLARNLELLAG